MTIDELAKTLHNEACSCVIWNGELRKFHKRGIADLRALLRDEPDFLKGALVADKVIGRAASAVLLSGEIKELYADVISDNALNLFEGSNVNVVYAERVEGIKNRLGTDLCPLEKACKQANSAEEILQILSNWK